MSIPPAIVAYMAVKRQIGRWFWGWSLLSILLGMVGLATLRSTPLWGALAIQFLIWGLINLGFAIAGLRERPLTELNWDDAQTMPQVRAKLEAIDRWMAINHKLDMLWLAIAGLLLISAAVWQSAGLLGHGLGVGVQGLALLWIDRTYARLVRRTRGEL